MPSLPRLSSRAVAKAFVREGWSLARQKGSHIGQRGHWATLSVPDHREITPGTLRSLIRASGLSVDEFLALVKK